MSEREVIARAINSASDCDGDDGFRACVPAYCACRKQADVVMANLARHGLAVLPVEPTFAMQRALMLHDPAALLTARESAEAITRYRAMLAAAKEDRDDA